MRKLYYMGLEPYQGRYTLQLQDWNTAVFDRRSINYVIVPGATIDNSKAISVGQVLDAHGRSYFALSQMMNLVQMMRSGEVTADDVVYFEDMFQPGIESLPYILNQVPEEQRPRIFVRCLAQTIDPDDFVHVWGMENWMACYEHMVNMFATGVLATNEEMVAHMKIAGWSAPIYNISGLAFGKSEVLGRVGNRVKPFDQRQMRVVFAARFDQEKQPDFFMDLIEQWHLLSAADPVNYPRTKFAVLSGGPLRSNNEQYIVRARNMASQGTLVIHENLGKNDYYNLVNDSRVMFNCALQDWVSNTVSEADTLGCNVLYPAYRSFPEVFANDHSRLYIPWSQEDAIGKLQTLLTRPVNQGLISDWNDGTIDRIIDIMETAGTAAEGSANCRAQQWWRGGNRYRDFVNRPKYKL